ncbi:MAG: sigma-70 family RNA polymerase sigma factor [Alphaproteobacteria bacterium]
MDAFREELTRTVPSLRAFARSLAMGDEALADDLVQDTCVNALRAQEQFTPGTNLKAWLFTILRNRFRSLAKRRRIRAEDPDDDLDRIVTGPAPQHGRLEMIAFRRAFAELRAEYREALVLAVLHGMSYEEIARICGCRVGTVKSRVSRARDRLREALYDGPEREAAAPASDHEAEVAAALALEPPR